MFAKMYGRKKDQESLRSIMDDLQDDLRKVGAKASVEDKKLLDEHATFVREMEQELREADKQDVGHAVPEIEPGVRRDNDNIPRISKMQIDLMVNGFAADFNRVATLQYTNSVGDAKMRWLGVTEGHHELSHNPDSDAKSKEKLTKINKWYCEQLAYLAKRAGRDPRAGRRRQPAGQHPDRLDQRAGQGQLAHARRHPLRDGGQRPRLQDGPIDQVPAPGAQPALALAGARHGPPHRQVRQPQLLWGRAAAEFDVRYGGISPCVFKACPN